MKRIFCFGELLLRLSPVLAGEWIRRSSMDCYVGGAELNVATALAKWDQPVQYLSALPGNYLSEEIVRSLEEKNIDCSQFIYGGDRIGQYYLPQGADLKHAAVIYDRAGSSFSELRPGTIPWETLLKGAGWFHFSAISPALSEQTARLCEEAVAAAAKMNLIISMDLNYRSKLWQYGKHPAEIMPFIVQHCDLLMGNIWSDNSLLGIALDEDIHARKHKAAYLEHARRSALSIMERFPKCKTVAHTFRFEGERGVKYYATVDEYASQTVSAEFDVEAIVDRVGSGDCFMAGLIYGLYNRHPVQQVIDFAAAAAVGKFSEKGDGTNQTAEQIMSRIAAH